MAEYPPPTVEDLAIEYELSTIPDKPRGPVYEGTYEIGRHPAPLLVAYKDQCWDCGRAFVDVNLIVVVRHLGVEDPNPVTGPEFLHDHCWEIRKTNFGQPWTIPTGRVEWTTGAPEPGVATQGNIGVSEEGTTTITIDGQPTITINTRTGVVTIRGTDGHHHIGAFAPDSGPSGPTDTQENHTHD